MIKRLNVKKNVRLLGVQWDGTNISECVSFCRYCHFSNGWMFIMFRENIIRLNKGDWIIALTDKGDWIIALTDKEFTVINNETYQYLFDKPNDVENGGE